MKKKSSNPIPTLKRKLWEVTRKYIYAKYKQGESWLCYTCDRQCEGSNRQAGHFIPDSICPPSLRYEERNLRIQCYHCNINLGGYGAEYSARIAKECGQQEVDELRKWQKHKQSEKWEQKDFREKIAYYEEKLNNLIN